MDNSAPIVLRATWLSKAIDTSRCFSSVRSVPLIAMKALPWVLAAGCLVGLYSWWASDRQAFAERQVETARVESNEQARQQEEERQSKQAEQATVELEALRERLQAQDEQLAGFRELMESNFEQKLQRESDFVDRANAATAKQLRRAQTSLDTTPAPAGHL